MKTPTPQDAIDAPKANGGSAGGTRLSAREAITRALDPRSVAVFGASSARAKFGNTVVKFLRDGKFSGPIYPINPKGGDILGFPALRSLDEAPGPVDVAMLCVPAEHVVSSLEQCVRHGVGVAISITSGFAEAGESGKVYDQSLKAFLKAAPLRLLGPNCEGVIVPRQNLLLTFSPMFLNLRPGGVTIISQSGAISGLLASRLSRLGVGIRAIITTGNEDDLKAADFLDWLADDPETRVILAYLEEIRDGRKVIAALRRMRGAKSLVIVKAGRSNAGQRAVTSHTGAIAGDDRVIDAVLRELGALRVSDSAAAVDAVAALAAGKQLHGHRIAVLSTAGGLAAEMTDLIEMAGLEVPPFSSEFQQTLRPYLPFYASPRNPVDMTGTLLQHLDDLKTILKLTVDAEDIDGVVMVTTFAQVQGLEDVLAEVTEYSRKPFIICWTGGLETTPEAIAKLTDKGIPFFDSTARALQALVALARCGGVL